MDILAYIVFPMNVETNQIKLLPKVETVIIDIGARGSDYMVTLEKMEYNGCLSF